MAKNGKDEWKEVYSGKQLKCVVKDLGMGTEYAARVRCVVDGSMGKWSEKRVVKTKEVYEGVWKDCPDYVSKIHKYSVDENNPRIATNIGDYHLCTIIGNTSLPLNKVTSWNIKILKLKRSDGDVIYIGVAPFDINQNYGSNCRCGWYFYCEYSTLRSGPPHNYYDKIYGPRKKEGNYVHTRDSVGVAMDTTKGELSFALHDVNLGVGFERIPLDKPLVPCVILFYDVSVELDTSGVKGTVDNSIPAPSNITSKNITWNSITLTWDSVEGGEFYQVEVDGKNRGDASTPNTFTKRGLLPETEHTFRVRNIKDNAASEWSDYVKGKTLKAPDFSECTWKECPDYVDKDLKYHIDENNLRIATKIGSRFFSYCTIIGNIPLPLNKVTSWSVKILKSRGNNGGGIYIGVAPSDINQNANHNCDKCGWYFYCGNSSLWSGPPHNFYKVYGPIKKDGQYVHTRDSVGVVMDTTKGDLSFALNEVNYGVAYEGIPLDKPLVPCVFLDSQIEGDSVEFIISEMKGNKDSLIPVPFNIVTKSDTWDSITLTWDAVEGASFYQVIVDGSKFWNAVTVNSFIKRGLLPETEHTFRVRTVRDNSVSEWSDVVKGRTLKTPDFSECVWEKCPDYVGLKRKYSVDENNLRIATIIGDWCCAIIGNTPIPINKVTSWSIKILKSNDKNGNYVYIGIAPFDINQNEDNRCKCGWYYDCYDSTLRYGPPQDYKYKEYGPRKEEGEYVHTGDIVGVVMDTTKGELLFAVNNVNLGVAYEGILLDKPLVPCVILGERGDYVELII